MHVSIGENAGLFTSVLTEKGVFCVFRVSAPVFFEGLMDGVKYCVLWPDGVKYCVLWMGWNIVFVLKWGRCAGWGFAFVAYISEDINVTFGPDEHLFLATPPESSQHHHLFVFLLLLLPTPLLLLSLPPLVLHNTLFSACQRQTDVLIFFSLVLLLLNLLLLLLLFFFFFFHPDITVMVDCA